MNNQVFFMFLSSLEGLKTNAKLLHWTVAKLNHHKLFDEIYDHIHEFQDNVAEEGFIIFSDITPEEFNSIEQKITDPIIFIEFLMETVEEFQTMLVENNIGITYNSLSALCDEFLHKMRVSKRIALYV